MTLKLVDEANLDKSRITNSRYQIWKDTLDKGDFLKEEWGKLGKALEAQRTDIDMSSFLDYYFPERKFRDLRQRVKGFVEGFDVGDVGKISVLALKKEWGGSDEDHQYHIHGGYGELIAHLYEKLIAAGGEVRLGENVTAVRWKKNNVVVSSASGKHFDGNKIIITAPIGVLQKGTMKFQPSIKGQQSAFNGIGFGGVIKFLLEFKNPFWLKPVRKELKNPAFIVSDAPIPTWWTQLP